MSSLWKYFFVKVKLRNRMYKNQNCTNTNCPKGIINIEKKIKIKIFTYDYVKS